MVSQHTRQLKGVLIGESRFRLEELVNFEYHLRKGPFFVENWLLSDDIPRKRYDLNQF